MTEPALSAARASAEARLGERIEARGASCAVVGLGYIGSTLLRALAAAGFPVSGIDRSAAALDRFAAGDGAIPLSRSLLGAPDPDVVVVSVRVSPAAAGEVDLEPLDAIGAEIARLPARPRLVVLVSTVPPGTTRAFARRWAGGPEAFVVHAPERLQVDDREWTVDRIPHVVGGVDEASTRLGSRFVASFGGAVAPVAAPEVAELSKLLENASNAVGIALVAEVTRVAHAFGVDMADVTAAAATKPFGYRAFAPGPGIGGHCIPNDTRMLRDAARRAEVPSRLLDATVDVAAEMPGDTVERLARLLARRGAALDGAEVVLVGLGFKVGTADTAATPARAIARELRSRGAVPLAVDSRAGPFDVDGIPVERIDHRSLGNGRVYRAAIVLAGDPAVAAQALARSAEVVLDAGGGRALDGTLHGAARF